MNVNKWVVIGLMGGGLLAFGTVVYKGQRADRGRLNPELASAAAIRGGSPPAQNPASSHSNMVVDYGKTLKDDLDLAKKNAQKYDVAGQEHIEEAREALQADSQETQ